MKKRFCFFLALTLLMLCCLAPQQARAAQLPAAGKVATSGSNLNVREKATTSSSVIGKLTNQSWVTLLEKEGNWWYVRSGPDTFGYCYDAYITPRAQSSHAVLNAETGAVNIYRGAGEEYEVKKTLPDGSAVAVLKQDAEWSTILFSGTHKGYVPTRELRFCEIAPVMLNVKRFAQTDARWKNIPIGTKGGTIGSIGCTTTCLAMTETYATGQTVTPAMMADRLTYTASGSLYWPSDYNVRLSDKDTLAQVYALLKSGKPVIFGAKKANGTQHWVVVTGCDGSGVSPAAFSINDPGSSARKTLEQFLTAYPNFYKIAWR